MIKTGLDTVVHQASDLLRGRRIGLVTHPAAVLPDLVSSPAALLVAGVRVGTLFGMEHGFGGGAADGAAVGHGRDAPTGLPVYSLYGTARKPTREMLHGLDLLVFDAQDVGVRFYTYISTLYYVLQAAAEAGLPVLVLDRPNPITGIAVEGPVTKPGCESFVGIAPIPIRYALTPGELAGYLNQELGMGADLAVIPLQGWRRSMWFDETGLPWVPTSPAMPHLSTAIVYPGTCLIEATNVSEGRGTTLPFEQIGAPWIDEHALAAALNATGVPGVRFRPAIFTPAASKYAGEECRGVQIHVTDRTALPAVTLGLHLLAVLRCLYPARFSWDDARLDRLAGDPAVRLQLADGVDVEAIVRGWAPEIDAFCKRREKHLLYR
ncbi:MAG TPA: DUF1343 domain-containing protein [Anaerolineae bacterium]